MTGSRLETASQSGVHTIAEIISQPETWRRCLENLDLAKQAAILEDIPHSGEEWIFVGCGSSFYLAQIAAATWSNLTAENARAVPASEILLFPGILPRRCQAVLISRSGQTSEVLQVGKHFAQHSVKTVAVTCAADSPIEKVANHVIKLNQADERSTVMTRSFTSMLLALQALAARRGKRPAIYDALCALPERMKGRFERVRTGVQVLAQKLFSDYVFLGQGPFFGVAQEAMLKVTEMSCSYAQSFHTLEFRHGPKAIVGPQTLVTFFLSQSGFREEKGVLKDIKELGGTTFVVTDKSDSDVRRCADFLVELDLDLPEAVWPAAMVIPGQLLGFYTGMSKGLDPDQPRHLTRVVTLDPPQRGGSDREP